MKTILVLTDFSERAEHALEYALNIASKTHSQILLFNAFYVPEMISPVQGVYPAVLERNNMRNLELLVSSAKAISEYKNLHIDSFDAPGELAPNVQYLLKTQQIWLVVMGEKTKEGLISRLFLGNATREIIDIATRPVLLVPQKSLIRFQKIVYAMAPDEADIDALNFLTDFAAAFDSEIFILHVETKPAAPIDAGIQNMIQTIDYPKTKYIPVIGDSIPESISEFLQNAEIDLLVMAHRKDRIFAKNFTNSYTKKMMEFNEVPLLVIPSISMSDEEKL